MALGSISDYGIIGDCRGLALIHVTGRMEWLAWPSLSDPSWFASLLGNMSHGHWTIGPATEARIGRRYRSDTLILETAFETADGAATLIDFMSPTASAPEIIRLIRGRRGCMTMTCSFSPMAENGKLSPRFSWHDSAVIATSGDKVLRLEASLPGRIKGSNPVHFTIKSGEHVCFILTSADTRLAARADEYAIERERAAQTYWRSWASQCIYRGPHREAVVRSLLTMRALTCGRTGGMLAAATTSLPEDLGGSRNWDYRFCWLRDATFATLAMLHGGYRSEAREFLRWLLEAIGAGGKLQPVYGLTFEREFAEREADWLPGFADSRPVRLGNDAYRQVQLGVYGEVFDTINQLRLAGENFPAEKWSALLKILDHMIEIWTLPDAGIWEQRKTEYFTLSRVMAWVALDSAIALAKHYRFPVDIGRWRRLRTKIHAEVCTKGFDPGLGAFTRSYGTRELDASLLLVPMVGFLPADDPRVLSTTAAIAEKLTKKGFVFRYDQAVTDDGRQGGEGSFLPCSFWLADNWILQGRHDEAHEMFERLLSVRNDLGLMSEEYDPDNRILLGNFPQLLTHLSLVHTACNLQGEGPAHHRSRQR